MIVLRRLASALPSIAGVIIVTFLLTRALPGDPAAYFAGVAATHAGDRGNPSSDGLRPQPAGAILRLSPAARARRSRHLA